MQRLTSKLPKLLENRFHYFCLQCNKFGRLGRIIMFEEGCFLNQAKQKQIGSLKRSLTRIRSMEVGVVITECATQQ